MRSSQNDWFHRQCACRIGGSIRNDGEGLSLFPSKTGRSVAIRYAAAALLAGTALLASFGIQHPFAFPYPFLFLFFGAVQQPKSVRRKKSTAHFTAHPKTSTW
jgi:hypothetical protein